MSGLDLDRAELQDADLTGAKLQHTRLRWANADRAVLNNADLSGAVMTGTHLREAQLVRATLRGAQLRHTDFASANLTGAILEGADLTRSNLQSADLSESNLQAAILSEAFVRDSSLAGSRIYGASVWGLKGRPHNESDLLVSNRSGESFTVNNLEAGQFLHTLLTGKRHGALIDAITRKVVLVLGNFRHLWHLRRVSAQLNSAGFAPLLFDWEPPKTRDLTETVVLLGSLARFVVVDLTAARSVPQELSHIVPLMPSVCIRPIISTEEDTYGMFEHFARYPNVLDIHRYQSTDDLIDNFDAAVLEPVRQWETHVVP